MITLTLLLTIILGSANLFAEKQTNGHKKDESVCGALGCFNDKVYLYYCSEDKKTLYVKSCNTIKPIKSKNDCDGPEAAPVDIKLFEAYVNDEIIKGTILGPVTQAERDAYYNTIPGNKDKIRECLMKNDIAIKELTETLAQFGQSLSTEKTTEINRQLESLRKERKPHEQSLELCENHNRKLRSIAATTVDTVNKYLCEGNLSDNSSVISNNKNHPLYPILYEFDPSRVPCGLSGNIQDRIASCGTQLGTGAFLVTRVKEKNGKTSEYFLNGKTIWGPEASSEEIAKIQKSEKLTFKSAGREYIDYWTAAKKYCESLNKKDPPPLGISSWELASVHDFTELRKSPIYTKIAPIKTWEEQFFWTSNETDSSYKDTVWMFSQSRFGTDAKSSFDSFNKSGVEGNRSTLKAKCIHRQKT